MSERDPRVDPRPGDVLRKWDQNFTVARVTQGLVQLVFPEWQQGIQFYRAWAKDADVMVIEKSAEVVKPYTTSTDPAHPGRVILSGTADAREVVATNALGEKTAAPVIDGKWSIPDMLPGEYQIEYR
jgi:hypothetical protein